MKEISIEAVRTLFWEMAHNRYEGYTHILTNGSKGKSGVGSAFVIATSSV